MDVPWKKIAIIGSGTLGTQIAMLAAGAGYRVKVYDIREDALDDTLAKVKGLELLLPKQDWPACRNNIETTTDMAAAISGADLVIEVVPEVIELKREVWTEIGKLADPEAALATNSSSIPVSMLENSGGRPEKSLNLHFYLGMAMVDIMGGTKTSEDIIEQGTEWIKSLGLTPLKVNKELLGFCFNRVWRAVKREVLWMWGNGFVDFRDVDRAWMIFNGMKQDDSAFGPFAFMDKIGLDVIYDIEMVYYQESKDPKDHPPQALKDKIERGELGVKTGRGFYAYPDPEYLEPGFLGHNRT